MIIIILKFTIWLTVPDLFLINSEYENQSGFFLMPIIFSPLMKERKGGFMQNSDSYDDFMRKRNVFPLILSMSIPMVISMLVGSLYNIVDSYFVAMISEDSMTALSLVFPIQNLIHSVAVGFGIGINAVIAFHSGAGNRDKADAAASAGIVLSIMHGIVLTILSIAVISPFLRMFTSSEDIIRKGVSYSVIVFSFAVIDIAGVTFEKIFQSVGRMKVSMSAMMAGCVANIILDPIFIFGLDPVPAMGIEGAALATGLGQLIALLIYIVVYFISPLSVKIRKEMIKPGMKMAGRLYLIGIPATLNLALPSILISSMNAILASFSEIYTLILGIYYKLQTFLYLPASGFVQGMRPVIGYNYGAGEKDRVRRIFLVVLLMCAFIMLFGTILCLAVPERLIGFFTENPLTIGEGASALRIISLGFIVSSASVAASGALEGLGKGFPSLLISFLRYIAVIIPIAYLLCIVFGLGPDGVWHSFWISEVITAIASLVIYRNAVKS